MSDQVPVNVNYASKAIRASSFLSGDTQSAEFDIAVTSSPRPCARGSPATAVRPSSARPAPRRERVVGSVRPASREMPAGPCQPSRHRGHIGQHIGRRRPRPDTCVDQCCHVSISRSSNIAIPSASAVSLPNGSSLPLQWLPGLRRLPRWRSGRLGRRHACPGWVSRTKVFGETTGHSRIFVRECRP